MARRHRYSEQSLLSLRELALTDVLDHLATSGNLFWRSDAEFVPVKVQQTERLFVSDLGGQAWELLVTGVRWFDVRAEKGGGGAIDLAMHLAGIDFFTATKLLLEYSNGRDSKAQSM